MGTPAILCVGALTLDRIYRLDALPAGPGKFLPLEATETLAGMASSAATAIARLAVRVALMARVGDDDEGRRLVEGLAAGGVDCAAVDVVPGTRSASAAIFVDAAGERMIVPHYPTAITEADPGNVAEISFGSVLADARWPAGAIAALDEAHRRGLPGVFDCDVAPRAVLEAILPYAGYIVASAPGAIIATGEADPASALRALARRYDADILVTEGAKGTLSLARGEVDLVHHPAFPVEALDTTAAGDVFHGAFMVGLAEGMDLPEAVRFASAAAAIKCTRFGGSAGAPDRADLHAFLESRVNG